MDYQELDEIRFDEIYEYDNRDIDEDEETEYYDNQYYPMDEDSISKISDINGVRVVNKLPKDSSKWQLKVDK